MMLIFHNFKQIFCVNVKGMLKISFHDYFVKLNDNNFYIKSILCYPKHYTPYKNMGKAWGHTKPLVSNHRPLHMTFVPYLLFSNLVDISVWKDIVHVFINDFKYHLNTHALYFVTEIDELTKRHER